MSHVECHTQAIKFSPLRRRQVLADFQGGRLTSDAGLLLLREVGRQIGLTEAISDCLQDPRDPRFVMHEQQARLAQRIFAVAAGYENVSGHRSRAGRLLHGRSGVRHRFRPAPPNPMNAYSFGFDGKRKLELQRLFRTGGLTRR